MAARVSVYFQIAYTCLYALFNSVFSLFGNYLMLQSRQELLIHCT